MLTTMIVSVLVPIRPIPASLPRSMRFSLSYPSQILGGEVVVVVEGAKDVEVEDEDDDVLSAVVLVVVSAAATATGYTLDKRFKV